MGQDELDANLLELRRICRELGVMDCFQELRQVVIDQQHLTDGLAGLSSQFRSAHGSVFVTREWVRAQMKRLGRGPNPELGLFDDVE